MYLASSDLTHYGPSYRFTPAGVGEAALEWAKANDRRLLERVTDLAAEQVVPEARAHANACGAGAIAAMLAACRETGRDARRACCGTRTVMRRSPPSTRSRRPTRWATRRWWWENETRGPAGTAAGDAGNDARRCAAAPDGINGPPGRSQDQGHTEVERALPTGNA